MKRLHDLETAEVSLVSKGANKKKFLVLKSDLEMNKELQALLEKTDKKTIAAVEKVLKEYTEKDTDHEGPLDEKAQAALKAVVRILSPFKGQLSPMLLHQVLSTAGLQTEQAEEADTSQGGEGYMNKGATQSPEPIKEEHHLDAMKSAMGAYKTHLTKLGYKQYPDAKVQQKGEGHVVVDHEQEDEQMGHPVGEGKHAADHEMHGHDDMMEKRASVQKALTAKLPKEMKAAVDMIFKEQAELVQKNKELSENLSFERNLRRKKEFVEKAAQFKHIGKKEELAETLRVMAEKLPADEYEKVEKMLRTADTQIAKGDLFSEVGSSLSRTGGSDAEAKIDAAVNSIVQKSENMTYSDAYDKFIQTTEGQRLYAEYKASRKDGI